jgi:hypothetical protein
MSDQTTPTRLSDEEIDRLIVSIRDLKNTNVFAGLLWQTLEKNPSREAKRRVLVMAFGQSYELLVVMFMAVESKATPADVQKKLDEIKRNNATTPG